LWKFTFERRKKKRKKEKTFEKIPGLTTFSGADDDTANAMGTVHTAPTLLKYGGRQEVP